MNTIREYVEVMFKEFPKDKTTTDLKTNILDTMERRFQDLLLEGKSENEAIGVVISQFGNIDELKAEYGLGNDASAQLPYLDSALLVEYLAFKKRFSFWIACGVFLIMTAVVVIIAMSAAGYENIGIFVAFLIAACGITLFVYNGLRNNKYKLIDTAQYQLLPDDQVRVTQLAEQFSGKFQLAITIGVLLCIIGVAAQIFFSMVIVISEDLQALPIFFFVAIAVFLFIVFGNQYSVYKRLLDGAEVRAEIEAENKYGWVFGVTMPLTAMLFLFLGLVFNLWYIAWILFPIVAISTTAVTQIMNHTSKK